MKANKKTLIAIKNFLEQREGWDLDELITEMIAETKLLKHKDMGEQTLAIDECGIVWGEDDNICVLSEFIDNYSEIFINKICKVLDSFVGEDISCYLEDEE